MKIRLFDFPDNGNDVAAYEFLGFDVEVDDPYNKIWSAELDGAGRTDAFGMFSMLEDCKHYNLQPHVDIDGTFYSFDEGIKLIDKIANEDEYIEGVGTQLD